MQRVSFRIVADCGMPLQEQIKNQIISSLYTGKIQEGDPLPSVRELAELAAVNPKTILKRTCPKCGEEMIHYVNVLDFLA